MIISWPKRPRPKCPGRNVLGRNVRPPGRVMGLHESTLRTVWRKKADILQAIKAYGSSKLDLRMRAQDDKVIMMERYLNVWISHKEREGVPLDKKQIQNMAMTFYRTICHRQKVTPGTFKASTGWLY